jgi:hypothetical protein
MTAARACRGYRFPAEVILRAVDGSGQTIDFLLSARRDKKAARRFFRKALGRGNTRHPRTVVTEPARPDGRAGGFARCLAYCTGLPGCCAWGSSSCTSSGDAVGCCAVPIDPGPPAGSDWAHAVSARPRSRASVAGVVMVFIVAFPLRHGAPGGRALQSHLTRAR